MVILVSLQEATILRHRTNTAQLQALQILSLQNPNVPIPYSRYDDHFHPSLVALFCQHLHLFPDY